MSFNVGDDITIAGSYVDITANKPYSIVQVYDIHSHVEIVDDAGDKHMLPDYACTVVPPHQGAMGSGNRAKARASVSPQTFSAQYNHDAEELREVNEEDTYEARKASARVTSVGMFKAGTGVVYKDGTPTLTSLTVKRCTATCVWFEETYSAAFDPNEFTVEY